MSVHTLTGWEAFSRLSFGAEWAAVADPPTTFNLDTGTITTTGEGAGASQLSIFATLTDDGTLTSDAITSVVLSYDWQIVSSDPNGGALFLPSPTTIGADGPYYGSQSGTYTEEIIGFWPANGMPTPITRDNLFVATAGSWALSLYADYDGAFAAYNLRIIISNFQIVVTDDSTELGITPASGSTDGGTRVTITGTGFTGLTAADITFDGLHPTEVIVASDSVLSCNTPKHSAGAVDLVVAGVTLAAGYTYVAAPRLTLVRPSHGPTTGGKTITLKGVGFTGKTAAQVTFGGVAVESLTVVSDLEISCVPAAHDAGLVDVAVAACGTLAKGYRYQAANEFRPTITDTDAANLPPVPAPETLIDKATGKITDTWLRWLNQVKLRVEAIKAIDAGTIISGVFALAQIPTIPWTKIDPTGSSLGDLTTRDASDLTTGTLPDARLATVNANVGTFGDGTHTVTVTADAKGRITAISENAITGGGDIKSDGSVAFAADESMGGFKLINVGDPTNPQDAATKNYIDTAFIQKNGLVDFTGDQSMGSHKLTNVTDPTNAQDAATKTYVDRFIGEITASVYRNTNQSYTHNTEAALTLSTVEYDTDTMWSGGSPTRLTVVHAGKYFVNAQIKLGTGFAGVSHVRIYKNGAQVAESTRVGADLGSGSEYHTATWLGNLAAADYLEVKILLELAAGSGTFNVVGSAASDTVVQAFKVNSGGVAGAATAGALVLLESHTASASATLDFTTRNATGQSGATFQSDYDEYVIEAVNLLPATNGVQAQLRVSTDGGATFDSGANYQWCVSIQTPQGGTGFTAVGSATGASSMLLAGANNVANTAVGGGVRFSARLFDPLSAAAHKALIGEGTFRNSGDSNHYRLNFGGYYISATAVNAFRLLYSSGNVASGTIRVYGVAK